MNTSFQTSLYKYAFRNLLWNLYYIYTVYIYIYMGQVAQAAKRLATGWTARVRSRVSEVWRFFFTPTCPDWPWGPLNLL